MDERRRVPRYVFGGSAQLGLPPNGPSSRIKILKISMGGCSAEGTSIPEVGQTCELVFKWQNEKFRGEVEVTSMSSTGEAGLKFLSMDEGRVELLRRLFSTLRLDPLPQQPPKRSGKV